MQAARPRIRHREKKLKTKTFTGCWTCRRRKVKCDGSRPQCARCTAANLQCEGYELKLYWVGDAGSIAPKTIKRQAMALKEHNGWAFQLDEVDRQIALVDELAGAQQQSIISTGPFGAFRASYGSSRRPNKPSTVGGKVCNMDQIDSAHNSRTVDITPDEEPVEAALGPNELPLVSNSYVVQKPLALGPLHNIQLFRNPLLQKLMTHYVLDMVNVLPPLVHPENPYSAIFVPEAMAGASDLIFGLQCDSKQIPLANIAILNILMSISAFHLRGSDGDGRSKYEIMARGFRAKALASLQRALDELVVTTNLQNKLELVPNCSTAPVETLISAVYTLITSDVVEGSMSEYWIHLDGVHRLLEGLQAQGVRSVNMKRLIIISSFKFTLAKSTLLDLPPLPWYDTSGSSNSCPDDLAESSVLELTFGITQMLADIMRRMVLLSQHISYYASVSAPPPHSLATACSEILEVLENWSIDMEPLAELRTGTGRDVTLKLARCHILAYAHSLRVYYHSRICPCTPSKMASHVERVAQDLVELETLKVRTGYASAATICWPGFIASCEAEAGHPRDMWYWWWKGMLRYRTGNIARLWEVVKMAWDLRDKEGLTEVPAWMPVLRRTGIRILAV